MFSELAIFLNYLLFLICIHCSHFNLFHVRSGNWLRLIFTYLTSFLQLLQNWWPWPCLSPENDLWPVCFLNHIQVWSEWCCLCGPRRCTVRAVVPFACSWDCGQNSAGCFQGPAWTSLGIGHWAASLRCVFFQILEITDSSKYNSNHQNV